jgi:hypothetical protein
VYLLDEQLLELIKEKDFGSKGVRRGRLVAKNRVKTKKSLLHLIPKESLSRTKSGHFSCQTSRYRMWYKNCDLNQVPVEQLYDEKRYNLKPRIVVYSRRIHR